MRIATIGLCDPGYSEELAARCHAAAVAEIRKAVPDVVDVGLQPDEFKSGEALGKLAQQHALNPFDALLLDQVADLDPDG